MTTAVDYLTRATVPLVESSQSMQRIAKSYADNTLTGNTALLAIAPTLVSVMGVADTHYVRAATLLKSFTIPLEQRNISGRALNISDVSASGLLNTALSISQLAGSSGLLGAKGLSLVNAATQLKGSVSSAINAWNSLGGQTNKTSIIKPSSALPKAGNNIPSGHQTGGNHLLVMVAGKERYYFNLTTAAFSQVSRNSVYNIPVLERLGRRPALQAVAIGAESFRLQGVIFGNVQKSGIGQINKLRSIAVKLDPVDLITGYGEALGRWYLMRIDEEQEGLISVGAPRKQSFTLEFGRYGDDYKNF